MKRWVAGLALSFGIAHARLCFAEAGPVSPEQAARAEQFFHDGTQAFEAARYPEAYKALHAAWEISPNYRTAAGLGQVELELAQYREAAGHLAYCLRHYPEEGDSAARSHVEEGLEQARAHVAGVRVRVSVEGAEVTIDGTFAGRSPLDGLLFVDEGTHVIGASRAGYSGAEQTIETPVRAVRDVSLSLVAEPPEGSSVAARPTAASIAAEAPASKNKEGALSPTAWVLLVGGSLTAAALATTVVFELKGSAAAADLRSAQQQATSCRPGEASTSACVRVSDLADTRNTDNQIATLSAIITGALAVATAGTAWYVNAHQRPPSTAVSRPFVRISASHLGGAFVFGSAF